jgi:hypothetical protein
MEYLIIEKEREVLMATVAKIQLCLFFTLYIKYIFGKEAAVFFTSAMSERTSNSKFDRSNSNLFVLRIYI